MKKYFLMLFLFSGFFAYAQTNRIRPNIIVFLVDDMGWQDTSVPFWTKATDLNKLYRTPNMQRLANEGMKFTNAYATPVCTPSRTSMMSGMNVTNTAIYNWTSPQFNDNTDRKDDQFLSVDWNYNGLSPKAGVEHTIHATVYPQLLKDAGYFTIHVGKAHWASMGTPGANPYNMGFMVNIAGHAAGHPQSYLASDNYGNKPGKAQAQAVPDLEEYYGTKTFLTDALTQEALKTLEAPIKNKQPFYLNMAHYAIHDPLMADSNYYQKYEDAGLDKREARYASLIEGMDKSLGDIMDYLKAKHIENNTIIIFMSDNGGLSLTPQRGGIAHTQNLPLKAGKGSVNEGGIREPMIVKWPGVTKPSSTANQYVIIEDFFPTILEMAKVKNYKTIQKVDGQSFVPILKNSSFKNDERFLYWHIPTKWTANDGPGINYFSAVRQGDWKLVYNLRNGSKQLYNLKTDIGEMNDLSQKYPKQAADLAKALSKQLKESKAQMPVDKTTNKPVPLPDLQK